MEAKTAMAVAPNTLVNNGLSMGLQSVAGTASETYTMSNEKAEAKIPVVTTWFALFFP